MQTAKVLVVLGNRMNDDGTLSEQMIARLTKTIEVESSFDTIIVSGGIANKKANKAEADEMKNYLVSHGVAEHKIVKENRSLTTKQNAQYCAKILADMGVNQITVLSSAAHLERSWLKPTRLFTRFSGAEVVGIIKA